MGFNKKFFTTGGIVASTPSAAAFDPLQNFETVTYTGNGGTQKITGYIRKGGAFNGSSSVITIPNIKSQLQSGASFTISCWVNVSSSQSGEAMIINTAASSGTQGVNIGIRDSTGLVYFQIRGNNNLNASGTTNLVGAGWKNIVLTHTTSSTILYVNGTQEASIGANTIGTIPNDLTFGKWANSSLYYLNGSIDQVRIFNTALNSTQVGQLALEDYTDPKKSTTDYFEDGSGIALYELDEDANSSNFEQAAVFNGSSSNVTLPAGINKNNNFSWSFWVNFDSLTDYDTPIAFQNTYRNYLDILANGTLHFYDGVSLNSPTGTVTTGTWYHVVITKSSSTGRKVYLNNSVVAEDSGTTNSISGGGQNMIGAYNSGSSTALYLDGKIDQVRIYDTALGSTDVEKLYKESADVPTANLVAHYKLDGDATDETETYDGTASNVTYSAGVYGGTPTNVNFLGMAFQPDLVITKSRDSIYSGNHFWSDSVRGAGKVIYSDGAYAEATNPIDGYLGSFDSNGFSLSSGTRNTNDVSNSGENYVAWCWKAGGAAVAATSIEATSATRSANVDAGFSIIKFHTSASTASPPPMNYIEHGLDATPEIVIYKATNSSSAWRVMHVGNGQKWIELQSAAAAAGPFTYTIWDNTATSIGVRSNYAISRDEDYIAYCFHSVDGYQKVGSYLGTNAPNNVVTTGFRPRWIMIKSTGATNGDWNIFDTVRENEPLGDALKANTSSTEGTEAAFVVDITDTGFELDGASGAGGTGQINSSGITYIYLAIA
jgi:hypothetical protein